MALLPQNSQKQGDYPQCLLRIPQVAKEARQSSHCQPVNSM
jgi:hypothetical protein